MKKLLFAIAITCVINSGSSWWRTAAAIAPTPKEESLKKIIRFLIQQARSAQRKQQRPKLRNLISRNK